MGIKVTGHKPGVGIRRVRAAMKVAIGAAAEAWHTRMLPNHFTPGGAAKYGYAKRTAKYMRAKARRKKHQKPLRWSGESEENAKTDFTISTRSIAGHLAGVVAMDMPYYFFQHPHGGEDFIDKAGELTRVTPDEEEVLEGIFGAVLTSELNLNRITA
jgi:hypothetical protein